MKKTFSKTKNFVIKHKIWTGLIIIVLIFAGYEIRQYTLPTAAPQYTLSKAKIGNIVQTVTGTGQVSATNQLSITSQVSGTIQSINVKVGQHVSAGDLIATIDPTNALNSLNSAKLALAKLTQAPKTTDLSNAQNSVNQSYGSSVNAISSAFITLQTVIPGLNTLLYGQGTFLSDQQSSYLTSTAQADRLQAGMAFDRANTEYTNVIAEYKNLTRQSSTSTITQVLADTYALTKNVANALQDCQNTITFITTTQPDYLAKDAGTAQTNVTTWLNSVSSDVSSLLSAQTSIASSQNTLINLVTGTDPLDVQSAQLTLNQAEQTYSNYFIRAPFDGVIGLLPASVYGQASNGTSIATIISDQKIATLSLNEVDASTVKVGDPVSLTFNAINNFTATGTVSEVDLVGTVSSGVVSYGVKVSINTTDARINPGMSVNAIITTNEIDGVLIVPSSAVKSQGNQNYVQTFDPTVVSAYISSLMTANAATNGTLNPGAGSSTRQFNFASTTETSSTTASTTHRFGSGNYTGNGGQGRVNAGITMTSSVTPTNTIVTVGPTDGTNTEIDGGVSAGDWVITKTTVASSVVKTTTTAPSLLSSLGAGGRGGGGMTRPAGN